MEADILIFRWMHYRGEVPSAGLGFLCNNFSGEVQSELSRRKIPA